MTWRRQLPVHSPLSTDAMAAGLAAAARGGSSALAQVTEWIRQQFQPRDLVLVDSGTSALALAMLAASRRQPGKPILLPTYSCYDLVTAAMAAGIAVRWYDLDPTTLQPDWGALEEALTQGAAAVVIVHHYGIPTDLGRVGGLVRRSGGGALIIEDAAQAVGGRLEGRPLGALGDFGVLSFGRGKGLTGGGGGALLANTRDTALLLDEIRSSLDSGGRAWSSLVSTTAQWFLARPSFYRLPASLPFLQLGATVFRAPRPPRGMAAAHAGVLSRAIHLHDAENEIRQRNASRLLRSIGNWSIPITGSAARAGYLRFPVLLPEASVAHRESAEARQLGIMPGYPIPLPSLPGSPLSTANAPGATILTRQLVTLPVHSLLHERDLMNLEALLDRWRDRIPPA